MKIHYEEGDAIRGDLIYAEARKISKPQIMPNSSRHKIQKIILKENSFSIIRRKLRFLPKN